MKSTTSVHDSRMKEDFNEREGLTLPVDKEKHRQKVRSVNAVYAAHTMPIWTELTASCFILVSANSSLRLKQLCPARMAAFCHEWPAAGGLRLSTAPEAIVSHDS